MNITNLKEGQRFKNYKALCEFLGISPKSGKGKDIQLKEMARYFKYERDGWAYIVKEIYPTPLPRTDRRKNNKGNSIYKNIAEFLILDFVITSNTPFITVNKLLYHINMVNQNYINYFENRTQLAKQQNTYLEIVNDFYNTTGANLKKVIDRALESLKNQSYIFYEYVICVCDKNNIHRLATDEEKKKILVLTRDLLESMGYDDIKQVMFSPNWHKFKEESSKLLDIHTDIKYFYYAYHITLNEKHVFKKHKSLAELILSEVDKNEKMNEINRITVKRLIHNAKQRYETASDFGLGKKGNKYMDEYRVLSIYPEHIKNLVDFLVKNEVD